MKLNWIFCCLLIFSWVHAAQVDGPKMHALHLDVRDQASLQRGAQIYMNYCSGCHQLSLIRYNRMARDIGIKDKQGHVDTQLLQDNLIFTGVKPHEPILSAMPPSAARHWFGVLPPDLSLVTRVRGTQWVYNYMLGFYQDPKRPWGSNNAFFPDVGMPNVLAVLQGEQKAVYRTETRQIGDKQVQNQVIDHLELASHGKMDSVEFDTAMQDLVNFLAYVSEPAQLERERLGPWILGFLAIFVLLVFLLKCAYWKDIK